MAEVIYKRKYQSLFHYGTWTKQAIPDVVFDKYSQQMPVVD